MKKMGGRVLKIRLLFALVVIGAGSDFTFGETFPMDNTPCSEPAKNLTQKWKGLGPWAAVPSSDSAEPIMQSPTDEIGTWVQIQKDKDGSIHALRITPHTQLKFSWAPPLCEPQMTAQQKSIFPNEKTDDFNDEKLAKVVESQKMGIIFIWSPQMPYSMKAIDNIREATKKSHAELTIILDSKADLQMAVKSAAPYGIDRLHLQQNRSLDLIFRQTENHFPSVIGYAKGHLSQTVLPGYALPSLYEKYIGDMSR